MRNNLRLSALLLCWAALLCAQPTITVPADDATLRGIFRSNPPPAPGTVFNLAAGVHRSTAGANSMGADAGSISGTAELPLVFRGQGPGATIIECPGVCFFDPNEHLGFENLTIRGNFNSRGLRNISWRNVVFDDPARIGGQAGGVMHKMAAGGIQSGPALFDDVIFAPHPSITDTVLDFVGIQGVTIRNSAFTDCGRGCLQAKGGSGVLTPFLIEGNHVQNAGQRGIFVGGRADTGVFNPPLAEAQAEFGAATIRNNVIEGGLACATFSTTHAGVVFENNLCAGQASFLVRFLLENPAALPVANISLRANAFANFGGPASTAINSGGTIDWTTIAWEGNVFNVDPAFANWPTGQTLTDNTVEAFQVQRVGGMPTLPTELKARGIGPQTTEPPPPPSTGGLLSYVTQRGEETPRGWATKEAALEYVRTNPCGVTLWRVLDPSVTIDLANLVVTSTGKLERIEVTITVTLPDGIAQAFGDCRAAAGSCWCYRRSSDPAHPYRGVLGSALQA